MILLDTHVAVWLAAGEISRLSESALTAIEEASSVALSPITLLEVAYLVEAKRLTSEAAFVIHALTAGAGFNVDDQPLARVVANALGATWTRDPFDRLLVGHAYLTGAGLVTKDRTIRDHYPGAIW